MIRTPEDFSEQSYTHAFQAFQEREDNEDYFPRCGHITLNTHVTVTCLDDECDYIKIKRGNYEHKK